jgi:hypothetical protein
MVDIPLIGMLERITSERRGELRALDLAAKGLDLDLDRDGLIELGRAVDHDDILAAMDLPECMTKGLNDERHWCRLLPNGYTNATAAYGTERGTEIMEWAKAQAQANRRALIELAKVVIEDQVPSDDEFLALLDPEDRPMVEGILERMAWYEQDHEQALNQAHDQHRRPSFTLRSPNISGFGRERGRDTGQGGSYACAGLETPVQIAEIVQDPD